MPVTTVCCVLRSGGDFTAEYVHALHAGVSRYLLAPHRFVCITDMDVEGAETVPLNRNWPGWWSKLEALDPETFTGRVILMDLDTLPVGNLYRLATLDVEFAMLRALNPNRGHRISGILAYRAGPGTEAARLFELFSRSAGHWMDAFRGDGEWLDEYVRGRETIQDLVPGIVSAKWDVGYGGDGPGEKVALALGHGKPRFSDPEAGWAHTEWCERAGAGSCC